MATEIPISKALRPQKFQPFLSKNFIAQYPSKVSKAPAHKPTTESGTPSCLAIFKDAPIAIVHTGHAGFAKTAVGKKNRDNKLKHFTNFFKKSPFFNIYKNSYILFLIYIKKSNYLFAKNQKDW